MSVDGSTDVVNQQLRDQLVIVMNRIQELEARDRQRQNGHNVGQQPANANGNTIKAAKPPMYSGDIGTDVGHGCSKSVNMRMLPTYQSNTVPNGLPPT